MMLAKRNRNVRESRRLPVRIAAWIVVACLVLAFPLAGCGNSASSSAKPSSTGGLSTNKSPSISSKASSSNQARGSSSSSGSIQSSNGVTPSIKAALDDYESFINEYCDFMKRYKKSGYSVNMLSDYSRFLNRYSEMTQKFNAIDETSFTAADSAYYAEVAARTTKRLSEIL